MFIPEEIIEKIRENNDIVDVISGYVSLKKRGKYFIGLCPFHSEKTPSFNVQQDKQIYHCFGCGEGGNVISFIMKYKNLGFPDAAVMLAERANIVIPDSRDQINNEKVSLREKLFEINKEAAKYFYLNLRNDVNSLSYFRRRGISPEVIKRFGLGSCSVGYDSILKYLTGKGYSIELIENSGLIVKNDKSKNYYDRFRNRIMFPVFNVIGKVIGFGGRVLDNSKPKYLNSPETFIFNKGNNLYGLNLIAKNNINRKIIIVEGYMDVIALHQYGIINAVATLGTALTKEQAKLLKRYGDDIVICYDSDSAGQAATLRGLDILIDAGCNISILNIPKGKDPDEFIRAEGKESFVACIENAMPLAEYKIKRKSEGFNIATTEGKIGFIKSSAQALLEINDPIIMDAYINKLSADTGVSISALYEEISKQKNLLNRDQGGFEKHINGNNRYNNISNGQKLFLEPACIKAEKSILCILYNYRESFDNIKNKLSCDDFNDTICRKIACILYEKITKSQVIEPAAVIDSFEDSNDMKTVAEIFNMKIEIDKDNINKIINDYINLINKSKLTIKKDSLIMTLKESEEKGDVQQSVKYLMEIVKIEKQLRMI